MGRSKLLLSTSRNFNEAEGRLSGESQRFGFSEGGAQKMLIDRRQLLKAAAVAGIGVGSAKTMAQASVTAPPEGNALADNSVGSPLPVRKPGRIHRIVSTSDTVRVGILDPKVAPVAT